MPTASDHRNEALALEYSVRALVGVRSVLRNCHDDLGMDGGSIAPVLQQAVEASTANVDHVARHTYALIDELHRRAAMCDQYSADMQSYEVRHAAWVRRYDRWRDTEYQLVRAPWPGSEPNAPLPPFHGAER